MKKRILLVCGCLLAATMFTGCGGSSAGENGEVNVYNWGEYIDEDVIDMFEEETGIKVNYKTFDTNEDMYPIIANGAADWDVVCPSEYMIQKMLDNGLLLEIDYNNIPNISNIDPVYLDTVKEFDPDASHAVPYLWGTVGILYNDTMVDEPITSWDCLWDEKYADNIVMMNNPRDVFAPALISCGYSLNSTDDAELQEAADLLTRQKPLVLKYTTDEVRDMMIGEKAAIGVIYSGEATICKDENENLQYVVPEEGSNVWLDCWVIPTTCKNKENAEKWIDFLCRPDIALKNFEYIYYSIPNSAAIEMIEDEDILNNEALFPGMMCCRAVRPSIIWGKKPKKNTIICGSRCCRNKFITSSERTAGITGGAYGKNRPRRFGKTLNMSMAEYFFLLNMRTERICSHLFPSGKKKNTESFREPLETGTLRCPAGTAAARG